MFQSNITIHRGNTSKNATIDIKILLAIKSRLRLYSSAKIKATKAEGIPDINTIAKLRSPDKPKQKFVNKATSNGVKPTFRKTGTTPFPAEDYL